MHRGNRYYEALRAKYIAEAVLHTYFTKSVGIGEHSDLIEEFDKQLEKLATAQEKLSSLEGLLD